MSVCYTHVPLGGLGTEVNACRPWRNRDNRQTRTTAAVANHYSAPRSQHTHVGLSGLLKKGAFQSATDFPFCLDRVADPPAVSSPPLPRRATACRYPGGGSIRRELPNRGITCRN